jgi:hypothetical protein
MVGPVADATARTLLCLERGSVHLFLKGLQPVAKGIMVVESEPADPDAEDEYDQWYREVHIPELLAVPGFAAARRYRIRKDLGRGESDKPRYLTVYDLEADDLAAPLNAMRERPRPSGPTPPLSPSTIVTDYELVE